MVVIGCVGSGLLKIVGGSLLNGLGSIHLEWIGINLTSVATHTSKMDMIIAYNNDTKCIRQ